jgi:predicted dehydrogenase
MGNYRDMQRRTFLKGAMAAAGLSVVPASAVRGAAANERLRLGIIGTGSRGSWLGRLFTEHTNTEVTAIHDYFADRVNQAGDMLGVPANRRFIGLDGYKELLATDIDAVAIESPPYFHPEQAAAAVAAGKHVYLAKPVAVDVWGCNTIQETGEAARGKVSFLVDFQTRADPLFQEAAKRVHDGMIGAPVTGQFYYYCGRLGKQAEPGTEVARLRNWVFDKSLSGDIIVEQNVHVLDVANWYLQGHPVKAYGMGGRKARVDVGDCWDHFVVAYTYPNEVRADFSSGQFTYGFDDLCMRLFCTEGTVESHYGGPVNISAKAGGWKGGETSRIYQDGAVANMKAFHESILSGNLLNNATEAAHSTLTTLLGRMAAYENREVTWDEMIASGQRLDAQLDLPADGPQHERQ